DMLAAMIENEPMTVDYVLIDYLIYYAVHNFPDVEDEFKTFRTLPCENRGKLATLMMQPYNDDIYKNLCKTDFVFKLSFRTQWQSLTPDGQLSFYGKLITKDH
ncbi:MAG: capsular polysaccharide synthesis protein, partial [Muribaculaceae bacterium]|nr:capsular polysaccharide synthesis protein [Muribaculaceae bacterium]